MDDEQKKIESSFMLCLVIVILITIIIQVL